MVRREAPPLPVRVCHVYWPDTRVLDWRGRATLCVCGLPEHTRAHRAATEAADGYDHAQRAAGEHRDR